MPRKHESGFQVGWTTVTYRSVLLLLLAAAILVSFVSYLLFPSKLRSGISALAGYATDWTGKIGTPPPPTGGPRQANFTNIDGTVRVKKVNSNTWESADYGVPLDKGDVVQTGPEGMAKVVFSDGSSYIIKPDSLIVIEQHSANEAQQTQVAVQVTTGTVDLSTSRPVQGSRSQVIVAGATATLAPESAAQVRNDPRRDRREVLLTRGSADVARGSQVVKLTEYEKVSFRAEAPEMTKVKELRPPTLIAPANMMPIFADRAARVEFTWTPVDNARNYHLRISRNPYFTSLVQERRLTTTEVQLSGFAEGAYYWAVQAADPGGRESIESERNRFTVIPKGDSELQLALELSPFVQHGHVIEVRGKTDPSARVMVNGQEVPVIAGDGGFRFFTPPLPSGENVITITAQNARGGVNTKQRKIVIQ